MMKNYKLLMDPVYDEFIRIERGGAPEALLNTFYIQRLRYIRQLGPAYYVYPGAEHTRFQHSVGTMWLAQKALEFLRLKGFQIDEFLSTSILVAALAHDLGHSPFSHALEGVIIPETHEKLTLYAFDIIGEETGLEKNLVRNVKKILSKEYPIPFAYQLISSQLDCDRLDYLRRDAFYTGVSFGKIDVNRILVSILVEDGELMWSSKGFNALESYVMSRYEMYWAVYFHKVNLSIQVLLKKIVERVKELLLGGASLQMDSTLSEVIKEQNVEKFFRLTDGNVVASIYSLIDSKDSTLSDLCNRFVKRNFLRTVEASPSEVLKYREMVEKSGFDPKFYFDIVEPSKIAYSYYLPSEGDVIKLKVENEIVELANAAPTDVLKALSRKVSKTYVVLPEEVLK